MAATRVLQAILPIRGKILNVEKARIDRIMQNNEVQAIISALGTGVHDDFDVAKLRYHKIVMMADADVDGAHIRTLLLTLMFRFMRPLIEGGYVYLAQPPLFRSTGPTRPPSWRTTTSSATRCCASAQEAGRRLPKENAIQRYKGLGEMNPGQLWETTMDPDNRILLQVTLDDAARADEMFSILMGEDVDQRRDVHPAQREGCPLPRYLTLVEGPFAGGGRRPVPPSALYSASAPYGAKRPTHPDGAPTTPGSLVPRSASRTGSRVRAERPLSLSKGPAGVDTPRHRAPLRVECAQSVTTRGRVSRSARTRCRLLARVAPASPVAALFLPTRAELRAPFSPSAPREGANR